MQHITHSLRQDVIDADEIENTLNTEYTAQGWRRFRAPAVAAILRQVRPTADSTAGLVRKRQRV